MPDDLKKTPRKITRSQANARKRNGALAENAGGAIALIVQQGTLEEMIASTVHEAVQDMEGSQGDLNDDRELAIQALLDKHLAEATKMNAALMDKMAKISAPGDISTALTALSKQMAQVLAKDVAQVGKAMKRNAAGDNKELAAMIQEISDKLDRSKLWRFDINRDLGGRYESITAHRLDN